MTQVLTPYIRPREKLTRDGVRSLSTNELLQLLIGSGNAKVGVVKIARTVQRVLEKQDRRVTYDQLIAVPGLGPATVAQLLAALELSTRFKDARPSEALLTHKHIVGYMSELRESANETLVYLTIDGGRRLITKRTILRTSHMTIPVMLRTIFFDVASDSAAGLIIGSGSASRSLAASMDDLEFARRLQVMAHAFMVTVHDYLIINATGQQTLKGGEL